jgi:hypothetical protein
MPKQLRTRLLGITLALVVGLLGLHATLHWHGPNYDHCQACHTGRVAVSQPAVELSIVAPEPTARFAATETRSLVNPAPVCTHRIPRAPPA